MENVLAIHRSCKLEINSVLGPRGLHLTVFVLNFTMQREISAYHRTTSTIPIY